MSKAADVNQDSRGPFRACAHGSGHPKASGGLTKNELLQALSNPQNTHHASSLSSLCNTSSCPSLPLTAVISSALGKRCCMEPISMRQTASCSGKQILLMTTKTYPGALH